MDKIQVKILNPESVKTAEKMTVCAARLTQRGHNIESLKDFEALYDKPYTLNFAKSLTKLPHPTLQKFAVINFVIVGASRRFLAQITRHQNEVKFMSASLQYSDYSGYSNFVVPYEVIENGEAAKQLYLASCARSMENYAMLSSMSHPEIHDHNIGNDAAGYLAPMGLRNILIVSATPFQWRHMIRQRICFRNTKETQFVMLKVWEQLRKHNQLLFKNCLPDCADGKCPELHLSCGHAFNRTISPEEILDSEFALIRNYNYKD